MAAKAPTTHVLMDNEIVLYQRERSSMWQCRMKLDGKWQRTTTKTIKLADAKGIALQLRLKAEIRKNSNLPVIMTQEILMRKLRLMLLVGFVGLSTQSGAQVYSDTQWQALPKNLSDLVGNRAKIVAVVSISFSQIKNGEPYGDIFYLQKENEAYKCYEEYNATKNPSVYVATYRCLQLVKPYIPFRK